MKFRSSFILAAIAAAFTFTACEPEPVEPDPVTPTNGNTIVLSFKNYCGSDSLILDQTLRYENANGDSFSCSMMKYYISNISFTDQNGATWYEPESYHLIDASNPASCNVAIANVPTGNYLSVRFMIGIDSTRNVSGAQTGALDPNNGMFWTWNSGYIMAKFEGTSPSSTQSFDFVQLHIGGFAGQYASQRWCLPSFNALTATVANGSTSTIHVRADLKEWFQSPNTIDFAVTNSAMSPGAASILIADNYADMFTVTGIDN